MAEYHEPKQIPDPPHPDRLDAEIDHAMHHPEQEDTVAAALLRCWDTFLKTVGIR